MPVISILARADSSVSANALLKSGFPVTLVQEKAKPMLWLLLFLKV